MNYLQAITAMEAFFAAQWGATTPVIYGDDAPEETPSDAAWVRFNINHNDGKQATMGSPGANEFRHIGIITIQIFTPEGKYAIRNKELTNSALEIYQGIEDSGITYYNVRPDKIGNDGFGWYQTNVIAEFRYDNIT